MAKLFTLPRPTLLTNAGALIPGAKASFFVAGTSTPASVYTDYLLGTAHSNPVEADGFGRFPAIYYNPDVDYKVTVTDASDVEIYTQDYATTALAVSDIDGIAGEALWPRTAEEISASITPSNYGYPPGDVKRYGAVGDGANDDSQAILEAMTVAHSTGRGTIYLSKGEYVISSTVSPGSAAAWESLSIIGESAKIRVVDGATAFDYVFYVNSTTNMDFSISGVEIDCNVLCANGIYVDVRNANPSTLTASGTCRIDAKVYDVRKASTITASANGILVIGAFEFGYITGSVDLVDRVNHASAGNECKGIAVSDIPEGALWHISARVNNVQTPTTSDLDGDGISAFGRGGATTLRAGKVVLDGCEVSDCRGRHIKIQTSDAEIRSCTFRQENLAMIAQSSSIDLQFGNGSVHDNRFYYRETGAGSSPLGSSHTVIESQQVLTDSEQACSIHDNQVFSEVQFNNFISFGNADQFVTLRAHNNDVVPIEDLGPSGNVITRAFLEFDDDSLVTDDGVHLIVNNNKFSATSGTRLIGYTGHNGTDDLDARLFIEAVDNENRGDNTCKVFDSLSGSDITLIEHLKIRGNVNMQALFSSLNFDMDNLPEGTDFVIDLATATVANGPTELPSTGNARIVSGSNGSSAWHPQEVHLEDGTIYWMRVSATWHPGQHMHTSQSGTPVSTTTPIIIGELNRDTSGNNFFISTGLANTNWSQIT